jgi:hypothetical protein
MPGFYSKSKLIMHIFAAVSLFAAVAAARSSAVGNTTVDCTGVNAIKPACASNESAYKRDYFYVGGDYVYSNTSSGVLMVNQIYVEKLTPVDGVTKEYPVVLFHGGGTTGVVRKHLIRMWPSFQIG